MKRNPLAAAIIALLGVAPSTTFVTTAHLEGRIEPFDIWTLVA